MSNFAKVENGVVVQVIVVDQDVIDSGVLGDTVSKVIATDIFTSDGPNKLIATDTFTSNGSITDFTLSNSIHNDLTVSVTINGVTQSDSTYTITGSNLTFNDAPAVDAAIEATTYASGKQFALSVFIRGDMDVSVVVGGRKRAKSTYTLAGSYLIFNNAPAADAVVQVTVSTIPVNWVQTSFNTVGGQHRLGGTPLRKNFAGIGYIYDTERDAFYTPKPYASWVLDEETCIWNAPVEMPADAGTGDPVKMYRWHEQDTSDETDQTATGWVLVLPY
jgi:hypothetical protein